VQPTHILQGAEYNELLETIIEKRSLFENLYASKPLLSDEDDFEKTVDALGRQFPEGKIVVLMGHGNEHHPEYNLAYDKLQKKFEEKMMNVHIGLVEGEPSLGSVMKRLAESKVKEVTLMPFMIVAGDHAHNDMASDEADSWKTTLTKAGIKSQIYLHGIGENEQIRKIYVEHAQNAL
jgi:sirohydrochlorin cobaltochelatase